MSGEKNRFYNQVSRNRYTPISSRQSRSSRYESIKPAQKYYSYDIKSAPLKRINSDSNISYGANRKSKIQRYSSLRYTNEKYKYIQSLKYRQQVELPSIIGSNVNTHIQRRPFRFVGLETDALLQKNELQDLHTDFRNKLRQRHQQQSLINIGSVKRYEDTNNFQNFNFDKQTVLENTRDSKQTEVEDSTKHFTKDPELKKVEKYEDSTKHFTKDPGLKKVEKYEDSTKHFTKDSELKKVKKYENSTDRKPLVTKVSAASFMPRKQKRIADQLLATFQELNVNIRDKEGITDDATAQKVVSPLTKDNHKNSSPKDSVCTDKGINIDVCLTNKDVHSTLIKNTQTEGINTGSLSDFISDYKEETITPNSENNKDLDKIIVGLHETNSVDTSMVNINESLLYVPSRFESSAMLTCTTKSNTDSTESSFDMKQLLINSSVRSDGFFAVTQDSGENIAENNEPKHDETEIIVTKNDRLTGVASERLTEKVQLLTGDRKSLKKKFSNYFTKHKNSKAEKSRQPSFEKSEESYEKEDTMSLSLDDESSKLVFDVYYKNSESYIQEHDPSCVKHESDHLKSSTNTFMPSKSNDSERRNSRKNRSLSKEITKEMEAGSKLYDENLGKRRSSTLWRNRYVKGIRTSINSIVSKLRKPPVKKISTI